MPTYRAFQVSGPVADAVLFLLSGMARAVSGEVLHVDGGYHALGAPMGVGPDGDLGGGRRLDARERRPALDRLADRLPPR